MSGGTAKERAVAEILERYMKDLPANREDLISWSYDAGREQGIEDAAQISEKAIGATRREIADQIRKLKDGKG